MQLRSTLLVLSLAAAEGFTPGLARPQPTLARTATRVSLVANADAAPAVGATKKELLAEAIGTGLITLLGTGTVAGAVYTGAHQGIWQIAATWGGAVALAAYSTAGISGAHLNPAVTLALVAFKGFPVGKALSYAVAQLAGAIAGAMTVLACFGPAIKSFELGKNLVRGSAAGIASAPGCMFFSLCPGGLSAAAACAVEGLQMAILTFGILSLTDKKSAAPPAGACALIGMIVAVLISVFGPLTCSGFNPARDMGPRIVASLAGWGTHAFKGWWVYSLGPFIGTLVGAAAAGALYDDK